MFWKTIVFWLTVGIAALFYAALLIRDPPFWTVIVGATSSVLGPTCAALVAWRGVENTINNNRRQEILKEWHSNLRWACEQCLDGDEARLRVGVGILDALDNHPELEEPEQLLVDSVIDTVLKGFTVEDFQDYA